MAIFQREFTSSDVTTGESALSIFASSQKGFWLQRAKVQMTAATASIFALCRPATPGTPSTSLFTLRSTTDLVTTSLAGAAAAWSVSPTSPSAFFEKFVLPATIGATAEAIYWTGPGQGGLFVPAGASISFQNFGATGTASFTIQIWE